MNTCFWRRQTFRYHDVFGWWFLPNLNARIPLGQTFHRVITNSTGMRSTRDYATSRPYGRKRVVVLGDSYTAGDGVSNGQRFTDLLEQRYPHLDVLNFGLSGSGTDQQLLIFEHLASKYETDVYIWCICVENIARNLYTCFPSFDWREQQVFYRPKPYFEEVGHELVLRNQPVSREKRQRDHLGDWTCQFPYISGDSDPYAIYKQADSAHWKMMRRIIARLVDGVRDAAVLIAPMPMYNHYLGENGPTYWPRFAELCNLGNHVTVVDILPALMAAPLAQRRTFRFSDDPHYTASAHQVVSDALEFYLSLHAGKVLE